MSATLLKLVLFGGCFVGVALVRGQRLVLGWVMTAGFAALTLLFASDGGFESPAAYVALGLVVVGLKMGALRRGGRGLAVLAAGAAMALALLSLPPA